MKALFLATVVTLSGCTTCTDYYRSEPFLREQNKVDKVVDDMYMQGALSFYLYSQIAENAYDDNEEKFILPKNIVETTKIDKGYGFQASIYEGKNGVRSCKTALKKRRYLFSD